MAEKREMNPAPRRKPRPILSMETLPATTERRSPVTMSAEEAAMAFSKVYSSILTSTCCARITRGLVHFITSSRDTVLIGGQSVRNAFRLRARGGLSAGAQRGRGAGGAPEAVGERAEERVE